MRIIQGGAVLASVAALLFSSACGSSDGTTASARPSASASASGGFAAYVDCLRQHGVKIPTARPSGRPTGRPAGGGMFGGGGANQAAVQACRSLAPRFQNGRGMQELQAFRSCLSDHGVTMPTPSPGAVRTPGARRTPGGGMFGGRFDTSDPKIAKAMKICRPLLPTRGPRPSPS